MLQSYEEFSARAAVVRAQIAAACRAAARDPGEVDLLAVTKNHPPSAVEFAARYGLRAVGENRVQEALGKKPFVSAPIAWELIGHLQSNKAKLAAEHFDRVQSVDSEKLLALLDSAAAGLGRVLPILLEINAGADPNKFGVAPDAAPRLLETALAKKNLRVDGLMTIAPLSDEPDIARRAFAGLRFLRDQLSQRFSTPLPVLSMGMSDDLEAAIAEGSTLVRIGTALFGPRG